MQDLVREKQRVENALLEYEAVDVSDHASKVLAICKNHPWVEHDIAISNLKFEHSRRCVSQKRDTRATSKRAWK
jgi:hypothetical protein